MYCSNASPADSTVQDDVRALDSSSFVMTLKDCGEQAILVLQLVLPELLADVGVAPRLRMCA